jgi:hypothetical protein
MGKYYDKFEDMSPEDKEKLASEYQSALQSPEGHLLLNLVENESHQLDTNTNRDANLIYFRAAIFLRKKEKIAKFLRDPEKRAMLLEDDWRLLATFVEKGKVSPLSRGPKHVDLVGDTRRLMACIKFQLLRDNGTKYEDALRLISSEYGFGEKSLEKWLTVFKKMQPTPTKQ